jgi:hypothetical protein
MFDRDTISSGRVEIVRWTARIGAVTAEALAERADVTLQSARARLVAAERVELLSRRRPLTGQPALYVVTPAGMRTSGLRGLDPCRVSASNAGHLIACAWVAAALERCYPGQRVLSERELRRDERERGAELASARLFPGPDGTRQLHRPDLVLWPDPADERLPVAVEVELSVKGPRRLADICRAWARCRRVAGVLYLVAPPVRSPLERAVAKAQAGERIVVVALDALPRKRADSK